MNNKKTTSQIEIYKQEGEALLELCHHVDRLSTNAEAVMFLLEFYVKHSRNYKAVEAIKGIIGY
jgi:hypothetical protein